MTITTTTATPETTPETTPEQLRAEYKKIVLRSEQSPATFKAAVLALLAKKGVKAPTPAQFVKAAKLVSFPCTRCGGTGEFVTMVVNGKPTGPGGVCFRCGGKGRQNDADRRRNYGYDTHRSV